MFQNRDGRSTGYKAAIPKFKTGKNLRLFLELENEPSQNFKLNTLMKWSNKFSSKGIRCMLGNLYLCCESYEGSEFCVKSHDRFKNSSVSQMGTCGKMIYFFKNISLKWGEKKPSKQVKIELLKLIQSVEYKIKLLNRHTKNFFKIESRCDHPK